MVAVGVLVLAATAAGGMMIWRKQQELVGFSIIAFFLLCIPSIQLIPYTPPSLVSDRWLSFAVWPVIMLIVTLAWRLKPLPRMALLLVFALSWSYQTIQRPLDWRSLGALTDADIKAFPGFYLPAAHKIVYVQLKNGLHREAIETANSIADPIARETMIKLIDADYAVKITTAATGDPEEAMALLWKVELSVNLPEQAKWNPAMKNFWSTIGFALIDEWEYMAKHFPEVAQVRYNAGLWILRVQKYKQAVVHLRAAAESPLLPEAVRGTALKNYGLALIGAGEVAEAEAPLRAALEQTPPDFRALCALADVYKKTGRLEQAAHAEADCMSRKSGKEMAQ